MPASGRVPVGCLVIFSMLASACGDPPEKEMQQAQGAIDAARAAGADEYAQSEFVAAGDSLNHAREAVTERDYRLALSNALDSREHAQTAAKEAADNKARFAERTSRSLNEALAALNDAHAKLKIAESARVPNRTLMAARQAITAADLAVQEARAAFSRGEYKAASNVIEPTLTSLRAATRDLEALTSAPGRRRR